MRITLDTNQLVRALMRPPELAVFLMAWEARRFTIVASHNCWKNIKLYSNIQSFLNTSIQNCGDSF